MPLSELITGTTMVYERLSADLLTALKTKLTIELKRSSYYNLSKDLQQLQPLLKTNETSLLSCLQTLRLKEW